MRYALFPTKPDAEQFAETVQSACDAAHVAGTPRVIICPFEALGQWAVSLPNEPAKLRGSIVDTVEPPVIDTPFLGELSDAAF